MRPSGSTVGVQSFYRVYPYLRGRNCYVCLVVKMETDYTFIFAAYQLPDSKHQRSMSMTNRKVFVSYDHEGEMLEVLWAFREGSFTPTDDERILKRLDDDDEVIGFLVYEMSTLKDPSPVQFELESEAPVEDVATVTVREAATRLGVSERRVRKLAPDGRVRGAIKLGAECLIHTPVEVIPGRRGPVGIAGRVHTTEHGGEDL